jgi:hypothetical protein
MATTSKLQITLIEVGQKEKEASINAALNIIDTYLAGHAQFLGDFATDPVTTYATGSTYYNTATSKLKVLRGNATWVNAA